MYRSATSKYPAIIIFTFLVLVSLAISYLMTRYGIIVAPAALLFVVGTLMMIAIVKEYRIGLYVVFFIGGFMFYFDRALDITFPLGTVYDAVAGLTFVALFISQKQRDWSLFANSVTAALLIYLIYQMLQLFNPNAVSPLGWIVSLRNNVSFLLYVVLFQYFSSVRSVKTFTTLWLIFAGIVAVYGLYQEYFGLADFELRWVNKDPERYKLYFIWGHMRKFSILSDPAAFGMFMAFSALASLVLAMGPFRPMQKIGFLLLAITMIMSMSYSGTRTATAMLAAGVAFFIMLTLHNPKILMGSAVVVFIFIVLMVGPFYSAPINRMRSTFTPSEDASMSVREMKRLARQPYVQSHPIGGGVYTTGLNGIRYAAGHPLADGIDPDSGFLLTALETGWIGLLVMLGLFFTVLVKGISSYYAMNDPQLKMYVLAYIVPFLALTVAHYAQDAVFQKPANLIFLSTYALVVKISSLEKQPAQEALA